MLPGSCPSPHWSPYFFKKPCPCRGVLVWRDRRRPGTNEPPTARSWAALAWLSPRGSAVLGLHGAKGTSPASVFFIFFFFFTYLDSASCQSRGACHPLPTLPVPELHVYQPHPPEDKGLHCLHSPSLAPYLPWPVWLPEEGRTRFLLLVLTPL